MLESIINSSLIVTLNFVIIKFLNKENYKKGIYYSIIISAIFSLINLALETNFFINFYLIIFSFSIIIFVKIFNKIHLESSSNHLNDRFQKLRKVILLYLFPLMITIFQIQLIWNLEIQKDILTPKSKEVRIKAQ